MGTKLKRRKKTRTEKKERVYRMSKELIVELNNMDLEVNAQKKEAGQALNKELNK